MKKGYTHVCVVLDASGSMNSIRDDVKGSLVDFCAEQRKVADKGETILLDVYQFSNQVRRLTHAAGLDSLESQIRDYRCGGSTALYDAICVSVDELGAYFAALPEHRRPESVVVAIVTDGEENASRRFKVEDVRERVRVQSEIYNWTFLFLASGIDYKRAANRVGLSAQSASEFSRAASRIQLRVSMSATMSKVRASRN